MSDTLCLICHCTDDTCGHGPAPVRPGTPGYCPCGGIILADTEGWDVPVCDDCYVAMGEPVRPLES